MPSISEASRKLDAAFERLDRAVARQSGRRGELAEALEQAEIENKRLNEIADKASQRLDATIARLRSVLED